MTRKENEKESERPHYYSQFWLDVAAGRRVIGTSKLGSEEAETSEPETGEHPSLRKVGRTSSHTDLSVHAADGRAEKIAHPVVEPVVTPDEFIEPSPEEEDLDLDLQEEDQMLPQDVEVEDIEAPDMDLTPIDEEEEDFYEEEEDEEEDMGWGGRGRKKPSPKRPTRHLPKKPKRDRRGY